MSKRGFTIIELLVACWIIFFLVGTFSIYANIILIKSKEAVLKNDLINLRISLKLYKILHEKSPKEIKDFFRYERGAADKEGNLLDPFKNKYIYNSRTGEIRPGTKKYENW